MVNVVEVKTKKERKLFVDFALKLYKKCPQNVPPLYDEELGLFEAKTNPSLYDCKAKFFLAYRDGEVVGRIIGIILPEYNKKSGKKYLRFSRYDAIDDQEVADALFSKIFEMAREEGMEYVQGPLGFDDFDREGLIFEGFEHRVTMADVYNYEYYVKQIESFGFKKEVDWFEYRIMMPKKPDERYGRLAEAVMKKYELREVASTMSMNKLVKRYGMKIFDLLNDAYGHLHGFVTISEPLANKVIRMFTTSLDTKYTAVVVDKDDRVVGFAAVLSDITGALRDCDGKLMPFGWAKVLWQMKHPKNLELALVAVAKDYKNCGVNGIIINKILKNAAKDGITYAESNLELETNKSVQALWRTFDKVQHRKRRCYVLPLTEEARETLKQEAEAKAIAVKDVENTEATDNACAADNA